MEITNYGHFQPVNGAHGTLFFVNELGEDWYTLRHGLTQWEPATGDYISAIYPTWAMVDADGVVTNVEYDPSKLMPGDRTVLGIDAPIETVTPGMLWQDGELKPPTEESRERVR
jgi:hypothetical protein